MSGKQLPNDMRAEASDPGSRAERALAALRSGASVALSEASLRDEVARLLAGSLCPGDHDVARELLEREIAEAEKGRLDDAETIHTLVAVVARYADPADALLIWRAREATPETRSGVDVEQMARAGAPRARRALEALMRAGGTVGSQAAAALAWLEEGAASGAFDDLAGYFAWSDERFGLHVSGPT